MKKHILTIVLSLMALAIFAAAPVVYGPYGAGPVSAIPQTGYLQIQYGFAADNNCTISLAVSSTGPLGPFDIIPTATTGDIGTNVIPGNNKEIIWYPGQESYTVAPHGGYVVKVCADDGNPIDPMPENFVFVKGGTVAEISVTDFYMDKYEITQAEYLAVMEASPSGFTGDLQRPVEKVSWFNAIEYSNRRSMQEGLTPCYSYSTDGTNPDNWPLDWNTVAANHVNVSCDFSALGYRLPRNAEWEYAARGGNQTHNYTYSGSNTIGDVAWYSPNSGSTTHSVGGKLPNELGLYDMSGNVWEWCWDSSGSYRVIRGGSWDINAYYCTVTGRFYGYATYSNYDVGFRLCRSSP